MRNVTDIRRSRDGERTAGASTRETVVLKHDERHLRRRTIALDDGTTIFLDLPEPVVLEAGDALVLEDGAIVEVRAATEALYAVSAPDPVRLAELAWHIGNRHLPAAIEAGRIVIARDHVIKAMLEGLGATVSDIMEPFSPVRGAYAGSAHGHGHGHGHDQGHGHSSGSSHDKARA